MRTVKSFVMVMMLAALSSTAWAQGFNCALENWDYALYDVCGGTTELPDGIVVEILHDVDQDGFDWTDPLATVCTAPPECLTGPQGTSNFNSFPLNGVEWGQPGGTWFNFYNFISAQDRPTVNRFYLRICVETGPSPIYYYSRVFSPASGASTESFNTPSDWTCVSAPCEGTCTGRSAIAGFTASDNSCGVVNITWTAYTDTVQVDSLFLTRGGNPLKTLYRTATGFNDTTGTVGETYVYAIQSRRVCSPGVYGFSPVVNDQGTSRTPPSPPTGVNATDSSCGLVTVTWNYATAGVDSFWVMRNDTIIHRRVKPGGVPTQQTYVHTTANPARAKYSVASISNLCGAGTAVSDSGTALQLPTAVVTVISATDNLCDSTVVTWTDVPAGSNVASYKIYRRNNDGTGPLLLGTVLPGVQRYKTSSGNAYTTYRYSIKTANTCGESVSESVYDTGYWYAVPAQVTGVTATVDSFCTHVRINWTNLTNETGYKIYRGADSIGTVGVDVATFNDVTGTAGTTYTYTVKAYNGCGNGLASAGANGRRKAPPAQVTGVTATDSSVAFCGAVRIQWNSMTGVDSFRVLRNHIRIGAAAGAAALFYDSTAVAGDTAAYSVQAFNSCGAGLESATNQGSRKSLPGQVTGLFAADTSCLNIFLKWNNIIREDSFRVIRDGVFLATTAINDTDYIDATAASGTTYNYRVIAANRCGSGDTSAVETGTRLASLPAVATIAATDDNCDEVIITWANIADEDSFVVKRDGVSIGAVAENVLTFTDLTAVPWTKYGYTVTGYGSCGPGAISAVDSGKADTLPERAIITSVSNSYCDSVVVQWTAVAHTDSFMVFRNDDRIATLGGDVTSYTDLSATAGGNLRYFVQAKNHCGNGLPSFEQDGYRVVFPSVPLNLTATVDLCDRIELEWDSSAGDADQYIIYREGIAIDTIAGTDTVYTDTGTTSGQFDYTISALSDQCGETAESVSASGERLEEAGQVQNVQATNTRCDSILITWDAATGDVDGYILYVDDEYLDSLDAVTTFFGYVPAATGVYSYTARAYSEQCGDGELSAADNGVLLPYPTPVTDVTATTDRCDGVELTWSESTGSVDGYIIRREGTEIDTVEAVFRTLTYFDDDAPLGDSDYDIIAYSENCTDATPSIAATGTVLPAPTAPGGLTATTDRCDSVIVNWTPSAGTFDVYKLYRNGVFHADITPPDTIFGEAPTSGITYRYTIVAFDDVCGPSDSTAGVDGLRQADAGVPENCAADGDCDGINVVWNTSTGVPEGYIIYRGPDALNLDSIGVVLPPDTVYSDTTVERGETHTYAVSAFTSGCGETAISNTSASLRLPLLTAVTGVAASSDNCAGILVTWTALTGSQKYFIYRDGAAYDSVTAIEIDPSFIDLNVNPRDSHYYKVAAGNLCGVGEQSVDSAVGIRYDVPDLVTGLAASDSSCLAIYLIWTDVTTDTGYVIFRDGTPIDTVAADIIEYTDAAADTGEHDYVIYAINKCGPSLVSETITGYRIPGVDKVTGLWASQDYCGGITVTWSDLPNEDGYYIYRNDTLIAEGEADLVSYADDANEPGSIHSYRVSGYNFCGEGVWSDSILGRRDIIPPQPQNLTATRDSCTSVTLTWDDLATEMFYVIVRDGIPIDSTDLDSNTTTYRDEDLVPGPYDYSIYAFNHCGDGEPTVVVEGLVADVPDVVTNLQTTMDHCTTVTVTWDDLEDELNYHLLRDGAALAVLNQNAVSYVDTPVIGIHEYRILASNICGIGDTTDVVLGERQGPPTMLPIITVPDSACDTVHYCWTAVDDITGYHVFRDGVHYGDVTPDRLCWWDLNQGGNTTIHYTVQGYNECGNGPISNTDSVLFVPTAGQVIGLTATTDHCVTVTLNWTDNANDQGYYVWRDGVAIDTLDPNTVQYIDSPAEPDTFIYRIQAFNDCGAGLASDSAVGIRRGPPTIVSGVLASDTSCSAVHIIWNDVAHDSGYYVYIDQSTTADTTLPANSAGFVDLLSGIGEHTYYIRAFNDCGNGPLSAVANGEWLTIPDSVTGVAATNNRCDGILVTWTDVSTDSGYAVYVDDIPEPVLVGQNVVSYLDTQSNDGPHSYRVVALNSCGAGASSVIVQGVRLGEPLPPTITAAPEACMLVTIFPASGGGDSDWFFIYRDTNRIDTIEASAESWQEWIAGSHNYFFTAYSTDCNAESMPSNTLTIIGHEPAFPPTALNFVEPAVCDSIRLTWPAGMGEIESYIVQRDGQPIDTVPGLSYTDFGVDDAGDHVYTVSGYNQYCGGGDPSPAETGRLLKLTRIMTDIPDVLNCREFFGARLEHCSDVESDSVFISLDNGPYVYLDHASPVVDSVSVQIPEIPNQLDTPNCRAMIVSWRGTRADTIITEPFTIHCDLAIDDVTDAEIPKDFMLDQNYPNPFNPSTLVRFGVPKAAEVTIEIYDIMGRHVITLVEGTYQPGWHKVVWDCTACPTGMYIMRMQTAEKVLLRKMLLMK